MTVFALSITGGGVLLLNEFTLQILSTRTVSVTDFNLFIVFLRNVIAFVTV